MADPADQLRAGMEAGSIAAVTAALNAGADPNMILYPGWTALHAACSRGHSACAEALLAAGANPNLRSAGGFTQIDAAAAQAAGNGGHTACVAALLAAGADPALVGPEGHTALHVAASSNNTAVVRLLLEAAPQTALRLAHAIAGMLAAMTPVEMALVLRSFDAARCLLELGALPSTRGLLVTMQIVRQRPRGVEVLPLYATLVARQTLTHTDWVLVPAPCPGLGAALPAVLQRSTGEAAQLVRSLPSTDRERLRTAALCLARVQRLHGLELPARIVRPLLALAATE